MKTNRIIKNAISIILIVLMCAAIFFTMNQVKNHSSSDINGQNGMNDLIEMQPNMDMDGKQPPEKPDGQDNFAGEMPENNNVFPKGNEMSLYSNNLDKTYYILFGLESLVLSCIVIYLIMSNFNKKTIKSTFINKDKIIIYVLSTILLTSCFTYSTIQITEKNYLSNGNNFNTDDFQNNETVYSTANEITEDAVISNQEYSSNVKDENAITVSGDIDVTLSDIEVVKTGDSDGGDNTSFYGINSAVLAKDGANLILKNITVNTEATGANGVFSYGGSATTDNSSSDNTTITISDSSITTAKDNSGGIMTTGGGIMKAINLTINTSGTSSAAIRTDRGGGTVTVDGGTYSTTGKGSPAIYSTADITVNNAKLISNASEGIVIEGKNSVTINKCDLIDSNTELNGQSTTYKNIFLYQSMSGDAASGTAEFTSSDSTITTNNGDTIYVTNTTATINLINNTIINNDISGNFIRIQKDSWGKTNENGGNVTLVLTKQNVSGNIVVDSLSTLDMKMESNSYYEGTINETNEAKLINIALDKTSKIKLTGDSYISSLNNADTTNSNIDFNGYKLYVNGVAIN